MRLITHCSALQTNCSMVAESPFAMLQNFMIDEIILDSEAVICGADDLYPGVNCEKIPGYVEKNQGKALHIFDGVNPVQPTHPVLTRKFIENNSPVFDERFVHNFCDTDLYKRHKKDFVKINDVFFDHRHWINSQREKDNIDEIANASFELDRTYYLQKTWKLNTMKKVTTRSRTAMNSSTRKKKQGLHLRSGPDKWTDTSSKFSFLCF